MTLVDVRGKGRFFTSERPAAGRGMSTLGVRHVGGSFAGLATELGLGRLQLRDALCWLMEPIILAREIRWLEAHKIISEGKLCTYCGQWADRDTLDSQGRYHAACRTAYNRAYQRKRRAALNGRRLREGFVHADPIDSVLRKAA